MNCWAWEAVRLAVGSCSENKKDEGGSEKRGRGRICIYFERDSIILNDTIHIFEIIFLFHYPIILYHTISYNSSFV